MNSLLHVSATHLVVSAKTKDKKALRRNGWHLSKRAKWLLAFLVIMIVLVSALSLPLQAPNNKSNSLLSQFAQLISSLVGGVQQVIPQPSQLNVSNVISTDQSINSTVWRAVAKNAWQYFQPGVGVDPNTGLPRAVSGWPYLTDWDLGVYIQAVLNAQKMGLIGREGDWGADARLNKVLTFLETRELNATTDYPYWFYQASDGKDYHAKSDTATQTVDIVDTGRLFVALNNLRIYSQANNLNWTQRIDNFVYNLNGNRSNYAALIPNIKDDIENSNSIYSYYIDSGFGSFFPVISNASTVIMNNISASPAVNVSGVMLPDAAISCDPLLSSLFELNNNDPRLASLVNQVYLAHEANYNATGQYIAFSEGNSISNGYVWEWVVSPSGDIWKITDGGSTYLDMSPIIYTKVAFSFLSLDSNSTFARNMIVYLERILPNPKNGYCDGADNNGHVVEELGSNTNSLILDAALYAIQK